MPQQVLEFAPVVATVLAVPQFVPQLVKLRRSGDTAGVSWSWAALTSVNNAAWAVYFVLSEYWMALVPAACAVLLAGALAVQLARRGGRSARAATRAVGWAALLAGALALGGRVWLGTALTAGFVLQVTPSVWAAYRIPRPTGISCGTWLLILGELFCWAVYGLHTSDPRLTVLGCAGVAAGVLMLARAGWAHRAASGAAVSPGRT